MKHLLFCLLIGIFAFPVWSQEKEMTLDEFIEKVGNAKPWTLENLESELGVNFKRILLRETYKGHVAYRKPVVAENLPIEGISLYVLRATNETYALTVYIDSNSICLKREHIEAMYPKGVFDIRYANLTEGASYYAGRSWGVVRFNFDLNSKRGECVASISFKEDWQVKEYDEDILKSIRGQKIPEKEGTGTDIFTPPGVGVAMMDGTKSLITEHRAKYKKDTDPLRYKEVQNLIKWSPTLTTDIAKLKAEGWYFRFTDMDSHVLLKKKIVFISSKGDEIKVVQWLSHEIGHALNTDGYDYSSKEAYVQSRLEDEGTAVMKNIQIQREILANSGKDITVNCGIPPCSGPDGRYTAIYDQYLIDGNAAAARKAIAEKRAEEPMSLPANDYAVLRREYRAEEGSMALETFVQMLELEEIGFWSIKGVEALFGTKLELVSLTEYITNFAMYKPSLSIDKLTMDNISIHLWKGTRTVRYISVVFDDENPSCFSSEKIFKLYPNGYLDSENVMLGEAMYYVKKRAWGKLVFGFRDSRSWNCLTSIGIIKK